MEPCHACGAALSAEAEWCGQCYALRGRASASGPIMAGAPTTGATSAGLFSPGSVMAPTRHVPTATLAPQVVKTRWRKTPTTYGPVGRLLATTALVVPFVLLVVVGILTGGFTIGGALIWGFVLMPWGLRDVWKAGQVPVG